MEANPPRDAHYLDSSAALASSTGRVSGWRKFLVDLRYIWIEQILRCATSGISL